MYKNKYFKLNLMFLDGTNNIEIDDDYLFYKYEYFYYSDFETVEALINKLDDTIKNPRD